jgi:peptidoglycan/LPS O-acetylase OafA/YrhL
MLKKADERVTEAPHTARTQFSTLHALRGLAALWVVFFHARNFGGLYGQQLGVGGPLITSILFDYGRGGVAIFFVLSGFVISHSLWGTEMPGRSIGLFMLRRSIRLDPPYWASIILALTVILARGARHGEAAGVDAGTIVVHLLYLQELLRKPEIQVVYWTLTYEIQFYFVYAAVLWWIGFSRRRLHASLGIAAVVLLLGTAFVGAAQFHEWVFHGLFLNYWYAFVAGVLAYAGGHRRIDACFLLCVLLSCTMLFSAPYTAEVFNTPAALTALGLLTLGRLDKLSGLTSAPFRALGTISYSLYLVHVPVIIIAVSVATRIFDLTLVGAIATFACSVGAALAFASLFWWAIERPSHAFARRIRSSKQ